MTDRPDGKDDQLEEEELELRAETLKDLETPDQDDARVRGGRAQPSAPEPCT